MLHFRFPLLVTQIKASSNVIFLLLLVILKVNLIKYQFVECEFFFQQSFPESFHIMAVRNMHFALFKFRRKRNFLPIK